MLSSAAASPSSSSSSSSPAASSSSSSDDDDEEDSELDAKSDDSELSLEDSAPGLEVAMLAVSSAQGTYQGPYYYLLCLSQRRHQRAQNRRHWGERGPRVGGGVCVY